MIIIEGLDNSGKSTLARLIASRLGYMVKESEGPPKSREEINDRVRRYALLKKTVVVRHPVISNVIYGKVRGGPQEIDMELIDQFYRADHLIVYCDPGIRGLTGHQLKDHDSKGHLAMVSAHYSELLLYYRNWAVDNAHIMYRIRDDVQRVLRLVNAHLY